MKPIQFVVFVAAFLLISCEKEETIVPTHQYNERTSSDLPLGPVSAIVIQNSLGPVIIDGGSDTSGVRWFLDKGILAEPPSAASQVCSQILVGLETINDTAYVSVHAPSTTASYSSLLSLTLPDNIPCVLRKISGTRDVSYLRSSFVGENVGASTILGRQGNCTRTGTNGDASVEIAIPDGGLRLVGFTTGNLTLRIPAATSSMLSAETGNGTIFYSALVITDSVRTQKSFTGKL